MVAIDRCGTGLPDCKAASGTRGLQALTAAALALPGMFASGDSAAADSEFAFQQSRYEEGNRNLFDAKVNNPIQVDSIHASGKLSLTDRIKFSFNFLQDTWSGATPMSSAPLAGSIRPNIPVERDGVVSGASPFFQRTIQFNENFEPLAVDPVTNQTLGVDKRAVHVMSTASPETRNQGDFKLTYEWDELALDLGGGISIERDYESRFVNFGGRWDFNQKSTTLNFGLSYTNSDTYAIIDHDAQVYIENTNEGSQFTQAFRNQIKIEKGDYILQGNREDWGVNLGLTQIVGKSTVLDLSFGYARGTGFMENPYKVMTLVFVDPDTLEGETRAVLEQRPDERNQFSFGARLAQYIEPLDAAWHFNYRFNHDDWGINAHTFESDWVQPLGSGWKVTPHVRYYSQSAADFYSPFLLIKQAFSKVVFVPGVGITRQRADDSVLPANFSSDHRLSGFGTLSGGVSISKEFTKGFTLEAGFEYYTHEGRLKLGGGGEAGFADFNYYVANAALKVDLDNLGRALDFSGDGHGHHHHHHHGAGNPAGLMFAHMMDEPGSFMVGYQFMYGRQSGDMLNGSSVPLDSTIVENGCSTDIQCRFTPKFMNMKMHMLMFMYAPTDWLNLMVMPQFVDMDMNLRELSGRPPPAQGVHEHTGVGGHETGGVGDTSLSALIKLYDSGMHHLHAGIGVTAPTGDVDLEFRRIVQEDGGLIHFMMQLGSGTWDFTPSLTYTGTLDRWSWGAQASGVKRLQDKNESGYALGDLFQTSVWGGYNLTSWLSTTVRGIYTVQGSIRGDFNKFNGRGGPMDFPKNHGGRFWDLGLGVSAYVPSGDLAGNRLSFEWIQPLKDDVNGFQLERDGALSASWSYAF